MPPTGNGSYIVPKEAFTVTMWTLCIVALLFLASRFAVRISTKGRLMANDYFLVAAIPFLLAGFALLQSVILRLYWLDHAPTNFDRIMMFQPTNAMRRFVAAVELIWVAIYCVKFCYFAQFKFYKPPYAYVDATLTRYYWAAIGLCTTGFVFTIIQPIVLCRSPDKCRYFDGYNTRSWEAAVTAIDIVTDVLVVSIPTLLVHMANTVRSFTIANFAFKSMSIFNIIVASTRLTLQYSTKNYRIQYVSVMFLLVIEATVAVIMVSISGYRAVFLDRLAARQRKKATRSTCLTVRHPTDRGGEQGESAKPPGRRDGSLSDLPVLSNT